MKRSQIFAHRGVWKEGGYAPNSIESILTGFTSGFAIETDVRDQYQEMVISHDPCGPNTRNSFSQDLASQGRFAVNIKSDGLVSHFSNLREILFESRSFIFDCSFPQILSFKKASIPHALRISEYEKELPWDPDFVWLDSFESDWWINNTEVRRIMDLTPTIIVSPELHSRDYYQVWEIYSKLVNEVEGIGICTDYPFLLASSLGI